MRKKFQKKIVYFGPSAHYSKWPTAKHIKSLKISLPDTLSNLNFDNLSSTVEITRDKYGIPHIKANNAKDAFFGQGFATAQDRLWHMDSDRMRAYGRWSEYVGEYGLKNDLFNPIEPYVTTKTTIGHLADVRTRDKPFRHKNVTIHNHVARMNISDKFWGRKHDVNQHDICDYLKEWRKDSGWSTKINSCKYSHSSYR